uniref:EOG090X0CKL n=1 Tax=Eubosmina coregoni TaxID=186181 RepID=A0A4Y7LLM5_9CRUS|nr:EOG090X0CKL [Eubosmina coregoni]
MFDLIFANYSLRFITHNLFDQTNHKESLLEDEEPVPDVPHEIYIGRLTKQVRGIKTFSLGTSGIGIGLQPMIFEQLSASETSTSFLIAVSSMVGVFTFMTPFLIHLVTKKYVTEIIYNPSKQEYTATILNLFLTKRKINFKLEDVCVPDVPGALTSFHINKIPVLCIPNDFIYPEHYKKFMGYDKPVDFRLSDPKK